jgi:hypothetical protein
MADKPETKGNPANAPATNVKAGFPGVTLSDVSPDHPGAQPSPSTERPESREGPSASASPGPHVIDDGSQPLPGQPEKDSASSAEEVRVRTESPKTKK